MSRLFGVRVSDPQLLACALHPHREDLSTEAVNENHEGWGIGFYQDDRALVKKRPQALKQRIDFAEAAADMKSPALLGHARRPTSGVLSFEDTHPFQFRSWLFAHHGMVDGFEERRGALEEQIPDFLRQHLAGTTDSERVFFLFLAALSEATRQRLEDPALKAETVARAAREAIVRVGKSGGRGKEGDTLNFIVTNGRLLVAVSLGRPLYRAVIDGVQDCARCRVPPMVAGRAPTRVNHPYLKAVLVSCGQQEPGPAWEKLPEGSMLLVERDLSHRVEVL
jgi:glutamine amidotransferase